MKQILFMTFTLFSMSLFSQEFDLSFIEDPEVKEMVKEKLAEKLADKILSQQSTQTSPTITLNDNRVASNQTQIPYKMSANQVTHKPTKDEKVDLYSNSSTGGYIGLVGYANSLDVEGIRWDSVGTALNAGITRKNGQMRYRFGLQVNNYKAKKVYITDDTSVDLDDLEMKLTYKGLGPSLSFTRYLNSHFGLGLYGSFIFGQIEFCRSDNLCKESDANLIELGGRMDLKAGAWNPYISIGATQFRNKDDDSYNGINAYVGLINFEL